MAIAKQNAMSFLYWKPLRSGSQTPSRVSLVADRKGLSTVEYVLLLCVIGIPCAVAFEKLGGTNNRKLGSATQVFAQLGSGVAGRQNEARAPNADGLPALPRRPDAPPSTPANTPNTDAPGRAEPPSLAERALNTADAYLRRAGTAIREVTCYEATERLPWPVQPVARVAISSLSRAGRAASSALSALDGLIAGDVAAAELPNVASPQPSSQGAAGEEAKKREEAEKRRAELSRLKDEASDATNDEARAEASAQEADRAHERARRRLLDIEHESDSVMPYGGGTPYRDLMPYGRIESQQARGDYYLPSSGADTRRSRVSPSRILEAKSSVDSAELRAEHARMDADLAARRARIARDRYRDAQRQLGETESRNP